MCCLLQSVTIPHSFLVFHNVDTFDEYCSGLLFALCFLIRIDMVGIEKKREFIMFSRDKIEVMHL